MTNSHQEDDIIKNSYREKDNTPAPYTPEYKRLKVNPILQDFSSLDGEFISTTGSAEVEPSFSSENSQPITNSHILDNNENVSYGFGLKPPPPKNTEPSEIGEFVLMVFGTVVSHGNHEQVLAEAKSILYKEHPNFLDKKVQINDIVVLKKIRLKAGVFLDV